MSYCAKYFRILLLVWLAITNWHTALKIKIADDRFFGIKLNYFQKFLWLGQNANQNDKKKFFGSIRSMTTQTLASVCQSK